MENYCEYCSKLLSNKKISIEHNNSHLFLCSKINQTICTKCYIKNILLINNNFTLLPKIKNKQITTQFFIDLKNNFNYIRTFTCPFCNELYTLHNIKIINSYQRLEGHLIKNHSEFMLYHILNQELQLHNSKHKYLLSTIKQILYMYNRNYYIDIDSNIIEYTNDDIIKGKIILRFFRKYLKYYISKKLFEINQNIIFYPGIGIEYFKAFNHYNTIKT